MKQRFKKITEKGVGLDKDGNELPIKETSGEQSQADSPRDKREESLEKKGKRVHGDKELGIESYYQLTTEGNDFQDEWDDQLCKNIDFSDDEDVEEEGGLTIKNAAKYAELERKPELNMKGDVIPRVNELDYYKRIEKLTVYPFDKWDEQKASYFKLKKQYQAKAQELDRNFGFGE